MLKKYEKNGFCVHYPEGWELEEDAEGAGDVLTLYAPDENGFITFTRLPGAFELEQVTREIVNSYAENYENCDVSQASETYGPHVLTGEDVDFFYLDFPCVASVRALRHGDAVYVIVAQRFVSSADLTEADFSQIIRMWVEDLGKVK